MNRTLKKFGFWASVFVLVSPAVLVFLWMISLSLKNELDNTAFPPVFIPNPPTLKNYVDVFAQNNFGLYLWNSILVTGGAVLLGLLVGVPAGYGIARGKAHKFAVLILVARMTPALSYLIPLFLLFQITYLIKPIFRQIFTAKFKFFRFFLSFHFAEFFLQPRPYAHSAVNTRMWTM